MSKISRAAETEHAKQTLRLNETVKNFMNGDSYKINPLDTLKMISASSIFGEPSYYRGSKLSKHSNAYIKDYMMGTSIFDTSIYNENTEDVFTKAIDNALDYDFEGTILWAVELRKQFNMRLNPQVIMARAAIYPKRNEFTANAAPGTFRKIMNECMTRADDCLNGMAYFMYIKGNKNKMPSIMKRAYADSLNALTKYQVKKYMNSGIGIINGVRICHANSSVLDELMTTGDIKIAETDTTWEVLRSEGKSWTEIFNTIKMGHMALLRNLRGFFTEVSDESICKKYLDSLKAGVLTGKQFPFRYYSAYKAVKKSNVNHKAMILDCLEDCIDISCENMPKLKGRTVILTDNSGSAWGAINSEYGTVTIAEINNLSAVISASRSDEGVVIKFGDTIKKFEITKHNGILKQAEEISNLRYSDVGGFTEGGIWEFFDDAINKKEYWDNIFIYSDMQAGHNDLYGTREQAAKYSSVYGDRGTYINVYKLILDYRKFVNKKVNVFSIQTAGYDNNVLPEYSYRTNLLYGWTGRESLFANEMINLWNIIDDR